MELRYYHNADTGLPHIYDHGVSESEVKWVLDHPGEDGPSAGDSRQAIGQTESGRYLRVIYVPDPGGQSAFVVTAYPLTGKPLQAYRRRQRRRRRGR